MMSVLGGRFAVACIVALGLGSARAFVVGFSKHPLKILQTTRPFATATTQEQQPTRVDETYYWPYRTKAGHTQQFRINYRVVQDDDTENTKQPLLLVHGFGANLGHFRYQYDELVAAGYKVYAIDLLGFGASEKPPNAADVGFSVELFVQQVVDFMNSRNEDQPWVLAGNSIGGLTCLGTAAYHSKRPSLCHFDLSSIVLFNTSGGMSGFRYSDVPAWAHPLMVLFQYVVLGETVGGFFFENFSRKETVKMLLESVYGDKTNVDDELLELILEPAMDKHAKEVFLAVFGGPPGPPAEDLLPFVKVPILALWGESDPFTPLDAERGGRNLLNFHNDFTLEIIPEAGHCPHDENPALVNAKMLEFLGNTNTTGEGSAVTELPIQNETLAMMV